MKRVSVYLFLFLLASSFLCSKKHDVQSFNAGEQFYEDFKKALEKSIKDDDKQRKAFEIIDSYKEEIIAFDKYLNDFMVSNQTAILDYHSTVEDLTKIVEDLDKEREGYYNKMVNLHFQLIELMTEEEWLDLTKKLKSNMFNY